MLFFAPKYKEFFSQGICLFAGIISSNLKETIILIKFCIKRWRKSDKTTKNIFLESSIFFHCSKLVSTLGHCQVFVKQLFSKILKNNFNSWYVWK